MKPQFHCQILYYTSCWPIDPQGRLWNRNKQKHPTNVTCHTLGCPPSQDSSGKWRFIGIPYWKCNNPGGDWNPGRGDNPIYTYIYIIYIYLFYLPQSPAKKNQHNLKKFLSTQINSTGRWRLSIWRSNPGSKKISRTEAPFGHPLSSLSWWRFDWFFSKKAV